MENNTNVHEREILDALMKIDEESLRALFGRARKADENGANVGAPNWYPNPLEEPSNEIAEYNEKISMLIDLVESKEESIDARLGLVEFLKSLYKENSTNSTQVNDDLEAEMIAWHKEHFNGKRKWEETSGEYLTRESQLDIARHFAQWQKEKTKGKKWIFEDEYRKDMERSFQDGRDEMREQMLKEAVDGVIYGDVRSQEDQPYQIYAESDYLPMDKFKQYDRVKLIVIKEG